MLSLTILPIAIRDHQVCHLGQCIPDPRKRQTPSRSPYSSYNQSQASAKSAAARPDSRVARPTRAPTLRGRSNSLPGITHSPEIPSFRMRGPRGPRNREALLQRRRLRNRLRNGRRRRPRRRRRRKCCEQ